VPLAAPYSMRCSSEEGDAYLTPDGQSSHPRGMFQA